MNTGQGTLATPPRERPILFSAPMVRALLAGTKTQTRRIVKFKPEPARAEPQVDHFDPVHGVLFWHVGTNRFQNRCPYGAEGDRLWVKESIRRGPTILKSSGDVYDSADFIADGTQTNLGVTRLNSTTHTHGFDAHGPAPLIASQSSAYALRAASGPKQRTSPGSPLMRAAIGALGSMPSARASSSLIALSRSHRAPTTSSVMRDALRGMWIDGSALFFHGHVS